jgi:hypothetical protein
MASIVGDLPKSHRKLQSTAARYRKKRAKKVATGVAMR